MGNFLTRMSNIGMSKRAVDWVVYYTLVSVPPMFIPDIINATHFGMQFSTTKRIARVVIASLVLVAGLYLKRGHWREDLPINERKRCHSIWLGLYGITTLALFCVILNGIFSNQFSVYLESVPVGIHHHKKSVLEKVELSVLTFAGTLDVLSLVAVYQRIQQLSVGKKNH